MSTTIRLGQAWLRTGTPPAMTGAKIRLGHAALTAPPEPVTIRLGCAAIIETPAQVTIRLGYAALTTPATAYPIYVRRSGTWRPVRLYRRISGAWVLIAPTA